MATFRRARSRRSRRRPRRGRSRARTAVDPRRRRAVHRSHRDLGLDVRMRIVAFEAEILVAEREQILNDRTDAHSRQRARRTRELEPRLLEMIEIEMRVAERMDE